MKTTQNTRRQRIEALAAIAFGRAEDGRPEKGWQRKLARAIGAASSTITATLDLDHDSPPMDRKLAAYARELRTTIADSMAELERLEIEFGDTPIEPRRNTLMTFEDFKSSAPARDTVRALIGLDIEPIKNWRDYVNAVAGRVDNAVIAKARDMGSATSTGEYAVLLATLFSMDYVWLAKEIEKQTGRSFLACMSRTYGDHAKAVAAVMVMGD
ncbi:hypothetical protein [Pelagibacterium sediminicola]|uniref:hypothetical protein n=1 Tax=Pelagibacterium sediminicola TaxID=2248761 RepID=UPI000E30E30E|nr:hypothetical protein [Pelagibacterium sediminicola]